MDQPTSTTQPAVTPEVLYLPATTQPQTTVKQPVTKDVSKGGRPTDLTDLVVTNLVAAFQRGMSDTKACEYAQISRMSFYRWMKDNEEFCYNIKRAKNFWIEQAGETLTDVLQSRDPGIIKTRVSVAKWVYEKHMPEEYGNKYNKEDPNGSGNNTQNNYFFITDGDLKSTIGKSGLGSLKADDIIQASADAERNQAAAMGARAEQEAPMVVDK